MYPCFHLGMSGREKGLKKLMAINLLKRLESSVNSFRLTLERMKQQIDETLEAIDTFFETRQDVRISIQTMESMLDGDTAHRPDEHGADQSCDGHVLCSIPANRHIVACVSFNNRSVSCALGLLVSG